MTHPTRGPARPAPAWAIALALTALTFAVRAPTFGNPFLGFDEQFYLLVGDRMLHGALPYVDIFDRKPIGLFLLYAATRALGPRRRPPDTSSPPPPLPPQPPSSSTASRSASPPRSALQPLQSRTSSG